VVSGRCIWCNRDGGALERIEVASYGPGSRSRRARQTWVHAEHREAARAYFSALERSGWPMAIWILALVGLQLCSIPCAASGWISDRQLVAWIGATLALQGAIVHRHPFCTPETIALFGVARSVQLARWIGALLVAAGALMLLFGG
jgi:hypothetical protein